jgi:AcrR family transcriptional regulator
MAKLSRKRSARAIANDAAIREAGIDEILRVGVDHVSLRNVGARAGLTHGAAYARYEDVNELLVDLWASKCSERAVQLFTLCRRAAEDPNTTTVHELIEVVHHASKYDVASIQLLLTARRIPVLLEEVERFINEYLTRDNFNSPVASSAFTRAVCVYGLMTAQIIHEYHIQKKSQYLDVLEAWLLKSLTSNAADIVRASNANTVDPFLAESSDDQRTVLAYATYVVVARSGYSNATISRIARRSSISPGAIYNLSDSKEELLADSFRLALRQRWSKLAYFRHMLEEGYLAQLLYRSSHSANNLWRFYFMEYTLATIYNEGLLTAVQELREEVHAVMPHQSDVSDEEKALLVQALLIVNLLITGVSATSTITGAMELSNYEQFAEPFRQAVLESVGSTWSHLFDMIDQPVEPAT